MMEPILNRNDINAHDICSTLHFTLDFETGLPAAPDDDRSWAPGTVRESNAMYSLVLNRSGGRWGVHLVSAEYVGEDDDQEHHAIFSADDQPDLGVLTEAFTMLMEREVLNATPR